MTNPARTWAAGDYPAMAERLRPAAEAAVSIVDVGAADRALDVATGTGNAALLAAARGARVTAVDYEPALLRIAERNGADAGLDIDWRTGDAAAMPVPDRYADVVLSIFGVMYVPDHDAAARELARVCAAGGRLALTAWTPGSLMPAMGQVLGGYLPPPPAGSGPPSRWGDPRPLENLLAGAGLRLTSADTREVSLAFADNATAAAFLVDTAGHVIAERPRLVAEGRWPALIDDVTAFVADRGTHVGDRVELSARYLLATAKA